MPRPYGKRKGVLERIVRVYEAAPALGNSTDDLPRRTEYLLARKMLANAKEIYDQKGN